jgi:hypothetical protein
MYDQNWIVALANLGECIGHNDLYGGGVLPTVTPYTPVQLTSLTGASEVTVGLLSDWGSGQPAAQAVMTKLVGESPDCIVHLGDVYYSGTPSSSSYFFALGEEHDYLVEEWPSGFKGPSFAMNSNHEMYSGAQGLFTDALANKNGPFSQQKESTCFALRIADWTILGLDSAYNADPLGLYMYGMLDLPDSSVQADWIKGLGVDPAKVIVMTHHNGFDPNCESAPQKSYAPFWTQVRNSLGADPYAWFWGHVHNGIVYSSPVTIPAYGTQSSNFSTNTYCRCIGHGALPYGVATSLNSSSIQWQAADQPGGMNGKLLYNGFATLTFSIGTDGNCEQIVENYYNTSGSSTPYTNTLFSSSTAR